MAKISPEASRFISRHIRRHKKMGMKQTQAVAVAHTEAREKGFDVPLPSHVRRAERMA